MYKPPVEIFYDRVVKDAQERLDEHITEEILRVGVVVDKDELIRAMNYDRRQYRKGYQDGKDAAIAEYKSRYIEPPRWIPASEPPKVWEDEETKVMIDYLVYSPEYGVFMAHWCAPMERWLIDGESVRVTHWQQLPEPPKEDE